MAAILDYHPELVVISEETDYYSRIVPRQEILKYEWRLTRRQKKATLYNFIVKGTHLRNYFRGQVNTDLSGNFDYSNFATQSLEHDLKIGLDDIYERREFNLLSKISHSIKKNLPFFESTIPKYWVEKTPKHTWHLRQIITDFPDSKFIFIYRDPRDNYLSYKRKYDNTYNPYSFIKSWNSAFSQTSKLDPNQVILVKYENLIRDFNSEIERVIDFLGIKYNESLNVPSKLGIPWSGNSMFENQGGAVHDKGIGRYHGKLDLHDQLVIECFGQDRIRKMGYTIENDSNTLTKFGLQNATEYKNAKNLQLPKSNMLKIITTLLRGKILTS